MHLSGVTGAAAPHQLTVLRRRLNGRVVSSDLLARVPTACLIRILPGASIPHSRIRVPWTRSTLKSRNRRRHGRPSARTYRARLQAAFIGPEMSRRRATASAKYRPSLTALPSTGAYHFKQWATVSRARRLDVCGRQPLNPRALCVVGASTDASVLLHRARDQAAGAASLAPSCHPEPRYSRCGYPCDPMWLRMRARLRWREQHQTGLPVCSENLSSGVVVVKSAKDSV
jgi:hypothetical protein